MSLVNQMLRDLDARHAARPGDALCQGEVVRSSLARRRQISWMLGLFLVGMLVVGGALGGWLMRSGPAAGELKRHDVAVEVPVAGNAETPPYQQLDDDALELLATLPAAADPKKLLAAPSQPADVGAKAKAVAKKATPTREQKATTTAAKPATARPVAAAAKERVVVEVKPAAPASDTAKMERTPHVADVDVQDRATVEEARKAVSAGKSVLAETRLRARLAEPGSAPLSREMLVGMLLQQGRTSEAERYLVDGLVIEPERPAYLKFLARIKITLGDAPAAVAALRPILESHAEDPEYLSLLAIAKQKLGEHAAALSLYRALLERYAPQASWWVGMAISLEATGGSDQARAAYQQGAKLADSRSGLHAFAVRRLAALPKADG